MRKALRIGAVICLLVAGLTLSMSLFQNMSFTRGGGFIIRKYTQASGSLTRFRLDCRLEAGGEYNSVYSQRFYDAASVGDYLEFPLHGYTRLFRDGKLVSRDFSNDLIFPVAYSFVALVPSIVFMPVERSRYRRLFYLFAGVIEVAVVFLIALSFFGPF